MSGNRSVALSDRLPGGRRQYGEMGKNIQSVKGHMLALPATNRQLGIYLVFPVGISTREDNTFTKARSPYAGDLMDVYLGDDMVCILGCLLV